MALLVTSKDKLHILTSVDSSKDQILKVEGYELDCEEAQSKDLLEIGFKSVKISDIFNHIDESEQQDFIGWQTHITSFKHQSTQALVNDQNTLQKAPELKIEIKAIYNASSKALSFEAKAIDNHFNYQDVDLSEEDMSVVKDITEKLTEAVIDLAELAKIELNVVKKVDY